MASSLQAETLRFSIGLLALLLGASLLIAPCQFDQTTGISLHPRSMAQDASLVLGGLVLLVAGLSTTTTPTAPTVIGVSLTRPWPTISNGSSN